MKKIMSIIMIAIMAICGSIMFTSCGDDDDDSYDTLPNVATEDCRVNANDADVTGKITWNGNKSSRTVKFLSWTSATQSSPYEWDAKLSDNNVNTTVTGKVNFTAKSGNNTIELYKKGETVFYQVVVRDVKYNGSKQDVKGNIKSFVVE